MPRHRVPPPSRRAAPSSWWTQVRDGFGDLVLGERCAGCGRLPGAWCAGCAAVAGIASVVGDVAGRPLSAAGRYEGPLGRAVVGHKERGRLALAGPLGRLLADAVLALPCGRAELLVPVPSAAAAVRARGQDHARRLASAAATELRGRGRPVVAVPALTVVREVRDQAGLSGSARRANVTGAFALGRRHRGALAGRSVVVVDDVVTTGSSLAAAVEALTRSGAQVVGCAVVASAGRQGPSGPRWPAGPRLA